MDDLDTEKEIAQNALLLLVKTGDPNLFDNLDVFEKNLCQNGITKGCKELDVLKQSLKFRIPWELRKGGDSLTQTFVRSIVDRFSEKALVPLELSLWAVEAWIAALGLSVAKLNLQDKPKESLSNQNLDFSEQAKKEGQLAEGETRSHTQVFSKSNSRLGIIFGEDSSGNVKVFDSWYESAAEEENSSLAVTPVKLLVEPIRPFKSANRVRKNQNINNKKDDFIQKPSLDKAVSEASYVPTSEERQAYELLAKGGAFAGAALKILAPIAVAGSVLACRKMGEVYYQGYGVPKNFKAAYAWLKISAEKGDAQSLFLVGNLYQFGLGVDLSIANAMQYFKAAADLGHVKAKESLKMLNLGL